MYDYKLLTKNIKDSINELLDTSNLQTKDIIVIGCSTSEVIGHKIGSNSNLKIAEALMSGVLPEVKEHKLFLAIQCCEHLNRALVVEEECAEKYNLRIVSVYPKVKAGGAMAETAMNVFKSPVVVESISSDAGLDIGDTLIGMHLKEVAVPIRLSNKKIGEANLTSANHRPPLIGGERAVYKK